MRTHTRRTRAVRNAPPRDRRGFTLVELIVGMVLLVIGVMGLVGVSALSLRQTSIADTQALVASVASSGMEFQRSRPCDKIKDSTDLTRADGVAVTYTMLASPSTSVVRLRGSFAYTQRRGTKANEAKTLTIETTILCP